MPLGATIVSAKMRRGVLSWYSTQPTPRKYEPGSMPKMRRFFTGPE